MAKQMRTFLGLGSNLGDREENLGKAVSLVTEIADTYIHKMSSIYETEPVGLDLKYTFLNAVLQLRTFANPLDLLRHLQDIEIALGRVRTGAWGPRTIDIDILLYEDYYIDLPNLIVPHPHLKKRRFVLEPLYEIAPEFLIDGNGQTVADALLQCTDPHRVAHYSGAETTFKHQ